MKIGHLQEATQFTVTEVLTFLVTASSLWLYTVLLRDSELRADPTTLHAYKDYFCFISHVPILLLDSKNALGCTKGVQTGTTCTCAQHAHTCVKDAGACDVATDVISTHSFPRWQNVKTDSGAGR